MAIRAATTMPVEAQQLENLHRNLFEPVDPNLRHAFRLHKELRERDRVYVETVVTYGAYEEPI